LFEFKVCHSGFKTHRQHSKPQWIQCLHLLSGSAYSFSWMIFSSTVPPWRTTWLSCNKYLISYSTTNWLSKGASACLHNSN
jgi:hypothetical protein